MPLLVVASLSLALPVRASASTASQLTRYPYLTDTSPYTTTVSWATDRSSISGSLTYGLAGSCSTHSVTATRTGITVNGKSEYQWSARLTGLRSASTYCYRIILGSTTKTDLLGSDASPTFRTPPASGAATGSYTFAVLGDWGQTYANGNPDQAALLSQLAKSGAAFTVFTGDVGYPSGTQTSFGDLLSTGTNISAVFGAQYWRRVGASMPAYATIGNHKPNSTFLLNFPENGLAAASGGRWAMTSYPSINGSTPATYPDAWYAFNMGTTRFYVLDASWDDSNLGNGTAYSDDYAAHWTSTSAEYQWLKKDLQAHPGGLKFAFFHYPLYSDQSTESSDKYLQGSSSLEGLLADANVSIAFSGHAHIYERNLKQGADSLVTYVTGGGGATLQSVGGLGCTKAFDAYAIGWKPSTNTGSACGKAAVPASVHDVYHFLLVTVSGTTVTVKGVRQDGSTFDSTTYDFSS